MASLTGTKIKDTYDSLLKVSDNGGLGASAKQITDGLGTGSPLYIDTSKIGVGITPYTSASLLNLKGTGLSLLNDKNGNSNNWSLITNESTSDQATINFSTGAAANAMVIDHSGNVGIGTNSNSYTSAGRGNLNIAGSGGAILGFQIGGSAMGYVYHDNTNLQLWNEAAGNLLFATNSTERMRITSGGYLKASNDGSYVNTTGPYHELYNTALDSVVNITNSHASSPYGAYIRFDANPNNTTNWFLRCASQGGASRLFVYSNGNVVNTNNSYGAISDAKLKENVTDASPKLEDLMQVKVRNFNYIGDDKKQLGVVAQELETIFPAMIDESTDFEEREVELRDENGEIVYETEQVLVSEAIAEELDADGNVITPAQEAVYETVTTDVPVMTTEKFDLGTTTKSVKYSVFVPMLIKAIQELKAEVDALKGA